MSSEYASRIAALHRALGIPETYWTSRGLKLQLEASAPELETVAMTDDGREVQLIRPAAAAWRQLEATARKEEIILLALSGFRSVQRQQEIFQRKLAAGQNVTEILRVNAAPGASEHHTGRALDVG